MTIPFATIWTGTRRERIAKVAALTVPLALAILGAAASPRGSRPVGGGASIDTDAVLLEACRADVQNAEKVYAGLSVRHEADRKAQKAKLDAMYESSHTANGQTIDKALEVQCGKELLYQKWRAEGCEKRLNARIRKCPCEDPDAALGGKLTDPDDGHGAGD